jgi:hypothetical protein
MKLFIFKPSKYWGYRGGGTVIAAKSFDRVSLVFRQSGHFGQVLKILYFFKTEKEVIKKKVEYAFDCWVLVAEFECPEIKKEKVILYDFNWT